MNAEAEVHEDFRELEQMYAERPAAYRRMVARWVALGYGYVLFTILAIVLFTAGGVFLFATGTLSLLLLDNFAKIGIPLLVIAGLMLRSVFTRLPEPEGHYLEGPLKEKILAAFEDVRREAGGQPIDKVVIVNDLNAAVMQSPRFGLFGPSSNYLILGVPLLQSMTLEEVRAVVAHEFGHLSHQHGRMGSVVYRLNQTLTSAATAIQDKGRSGIKGISFRFLDWFYLRFNKVTFAMRRGQEYEADQVSANATSAPALASALCRLNVLDGPLDAFWSKIWRQTRAHESNAQVYPLSELQGFVQAEAKSNPTAAAVDQALERDTDFADSHPCLRERLQALGTEPVREFEFEGSALDDLLSDRERKEFLGPVDNDWQKVSADNWRQAHADFLAAKSELEQLRSQGDLDRDEQLRLAGLLESIEGLESARSTYYGLVESGPDDAAAQYHWGRINLEIDAEVGRAALLRAAELDIENFPGVASLLQIRSNAEVAGRLESLGKQYEETCNKANAERETVSVDDELLAVDLADEFRDALAEFAARYTEIRRVFLVEKKLEYLTYNRLFLVGYDVNYYHNDVETKEGKWLERVHSDFGATFPGLNGPYAVLVDKKGPWVEKFTGIEGALIYMGTGKAASRFFRYLKLIFYAVIVFIILFVIAVNLIE